MGNRTSRRGNGPRPTIPLSDKDFAAMFASEGFAHLHKHGSANQYHVIMAPSYRPIKGGQAPICGGGRVCLKVPWPKNGTER